MKNVSESISIFRVQSHDHINDAAELFDLYRQFYGQTSDLAGAREFLKNRFDNQESVLFLAASNNLNIGFSQLYPTFSSVSMKRQWILNDLFVHPQYRKQGVGYHLLNACQQFAKADGAKGLRLETQKTNTIAKSLYENMGWTQENDFDRYSFSCENIHAENIQTSIPTSI